LHRIVFSLLVMLFIVLRFWNITTFSLWGGEAFTMIGVEKSWSDMFAYIAADIVHPPGIYVLLKLWIMLGGESLLWLKLFTVIPSVAVIVPLLLLCRELNFRLPETNLTLLLAGVNGYLVHYAQELRMYSLFMFLAMCSFWLFIRYTKSGGRATGLLTALTAINLLAIFTHYYGWVVVGMEFLFLLIWQRRKILSFGITVLGLLVFFIPWMVVVIQEARAIGRLAQNLDWIPKPQLASILNLYVTFNGPLGNRYIKLVGLAVFGLPVLLWVWRLYRSGFKQNKDELVVFSWLALLGFLPVLALFAISQRMDQAVWMDRYFIFIAIPYLMLVAAAAYRLKPLWLRNLWVAAIVVMSALSGYHDWSTNRMAWESPQLGSRAPWDNLVLQMTAVEDQERGPIEIFTLTVISNRYRTGDWALSTSIDYYLDKFGDDRFQTEFARDVQALLERPKGNHFWVAFFELTEWPQPSPAVVLAENGYRVGGEISFQNGADRVVLLPVWRE